MIWKIAINSLSAFKWEFGDWLIAKRAFEIKRNVGNECWKKLDEAKRPEARGETEG